MPYVLVEAPDRIVLAWSIQPIPDDLDVGAIEPLATVEVPAGGELEREATLRAPLQVSTHLRSPGPHRGTLPATVNVVAELGHLDHALDPRERHRQNYGALVAAQRTCRSTPVAVSLPTP